MINSVTAEKLLNYIKCDKNLTPPEKQVFNRIVWFISQAKDKRCYALNKYLAEQFGKSERTIRRYLHKLRELKYIVTSVTQLGRFCLERTIEIASELLDKINNNAPKNKATPPVINVEKSVNNYTVKSHDVPNVRPNVRDNNTNRLNIDIKEKKDILYKYNISKKEKIIINSKPQSYDQVSGYWEKMHLQGNAQHFWNYNTKKSWSNIRNWKRAAIGWARKVSENLAAFKANKKEFFKQSKTNRVSKLSKQSPKTSGNVVNANKLPEIHYDYNSWSDLL